MSDLPDLIARVESAQPEMEADCLIEGAYAIWGPDLGDANSPNANRNDLFIAKLDAGAGLCAAVMLLKEGDWALSVASGEPALVTLPAGEVDAVHGYAKTPALALLAAIVADLRRLAFQIGGQTALVYKALADRYEAGAHLGGEG